MASDPDDDFEDIDDSDSDSIDPRANVPTSKNLLFVRRKPAAGTLSAKASDSGGKSGWTCSACTFENQSTALRCEICATAKPQTAAAAQTNIAPIFLRAKPIATGKCGAHASTSDDKHAASRKKAASGVGPAPRHKAAVPSNFGAAGRHSGTDAHKQLRPRATALRKAPTLREKVRAMHASSSTAPATGFAAATPLPLPAPSLPRGAASVLKYRLPFFKSIAQLKAEGIAPFDFDHLFSAGASRVMLRTSEGCKCGPTSTCSKVCPCRKVGKLCDPALCKCSLVCCKNTKENALLEAAKNANMGHWITRDGQRVYFDKDGNEYNGSAAMRRYQSDKKGDPPPRKRKRRKQRRPRSRGRRKKR